MTGKSRRKLIKGLSISIPTAWTAPIISSCTISQMKTAAIPYYHTQRLSLSILAIVLLVQGCSQAPPEAGSAAQISSAVDIVNDTFPEKQEEIRKAIAAIWNDAQTRNIEGLISAHIDSEKFSKLGPRNWDRQDVESTNKEETAHWSSVPDPTILANDLKIDVFGDVGVVTYYVGTPDDRRGAARATIVMVNTPMGWKIAHENGTPRKGVQMKDVDATKAVGSTMSD
jgi:ketosteroid isomerase-like protein